MAVKMKYKGNQFRETVEVEFKIEMVTVSQYDDEKPFEVETTTLIGRQVRDLYEVLKEMYE